MEIHVKNVRLSWNSIFEPREYQGTNPKYRAEVLVKKGSEMDTLINDTIQKVGKEAFGKDWEKTYRSIKDDKRQFSYRDGDKREEEDYADHMVLVATAPPQRKPTVIGRDNVKLTEATSDFYRGAWVYLIVDIYASKEYNAVFCGLRGIKFLRDGNPLKGAAAPVKEDDFEDISLEEDDLEFAD